MQTCHSFCVDHVPSVNLSLLSPLTVTFLALKGVVSGFWSSVSDGLPLPSPERLLWSPECHVTLTNKENGNDLHTLKVKLQSEV